MEKAMEEKLTQKDTGPLPPPLFLLMNIREEEEADHHQHRSLSCYMSANTCGRMSSTKYCRKHFPSLHALPQAALVPSPIIRTIDALACMESRQWRAERIPATVSCAMALL
ncbi:hypothetical protein OPV22_026220 [Ensete ventricosum]|uniref:Uncharacterized protein n=1 Tax=Ensete ventricosum TaxID=4639 RepID=A0AAV8QA35_ENSVE|nr:hypothetical protein OPV22_026220 [Ensete ventricosum]